MSVCTRAYVCVFVCICSISKEHAPQMLQVLYVRLLVTCWLRHVGGDCMVCMCVLVCVCVCVCVRLWIHVGVHASE